MCLLPVVCITGYTMLKPQETSRLTTAQVDKVLADFFTLVRIDPSDLPVCPPVLPALCAATPSRSALSNRPPARNNAAYALKLKKSISG